MKKIYHYLIDLPGRCLQRWRLWQILPFLLLLGLSVFALTRLDIAAEEKIDLPLSHPYPALERRYTALFTSSDFILVTLEAEELYQEGPLAAVQRLSEGLQQVPGITSVISVATASDLVLADEELKNIPLLGKEIDPVFVQETISGHSLFSHYLVSDDGHLFSLFLFPESDPELDNSHLIEGIRRVLAGEPDFTLKMFGNRVMEYLLKEAIVRDFFILGLLALAVVFCVQWFFTRSLRQGGLLLLSSLLACVLTMALFPLLKLPLKTTTVMIPVIILALSTSYNIHLYRYFVLFATSGPKAALGHAVPVVLLTGFSTLLGFATLLLSSLSLLRQFGIILLGGIGFALVVALFFLPALLQQFRPAAGKQERWAIPLPGRRVLRFLVLVLIPLLVFLTMGFPRVAYDYRLFTLFTPYSQVSRDLRYFQEHYRGLDELELVIDSREEYGLVNRELYGKIRQVEQELATLPGVSRVIGFSGFVDWLQTRLAPGVPVESEEEIGENLELLFSNETGLPVSSLIDLNYRYAKLLIRFTTPPGSSSAEAVRLYTELVAGINFICKKSLDGVSFNLMGYTVRNELVVVMLKKSQFLSVVSFLLLFFLVLALRFRSISTALLVLLPGICNVIFFIGCLGWLTIPISASVLVAIAVVMGVSVDDALYFILFYRFVCREGTPEPVRQTLALSGKAIVHTTVILVLGISVLVFSRYMPIIQTSFLIIGSLLFADVITLFLLPGIIRYTGVYKKKSLKEGSREKI